MLLWLVMDNVLLHTKLFYQQVVPSSRKSFRSVVYTVMYIKINCTYIKLFYVSRIFGVSVLYLHYDAPKFPNQILHSKPFTTYCFLIFFIDKSMPASCNNTSRCTLH